MQACLRDVAGLARGRFRGSQAGRFSQECEALHRSDQRFGGCSDRSFVGWSRPRANHFLDLDRRGTSFFLLHGRSWEIFVFNTKGPRIE